MISLKPIETVYQGYRFRSRLEARWAVLFGSLGMKWEYEPEGFDLNGVWYLPDFRLPDLSLWVEVKPDASLSAHDQQKTRRFRDALSLDYIERFRTSTAPDSVESWRLITVSGAPFRDQNREQTYRTGDGFHQTFIDCLVCRHIQISREPWYGPDEVQYFCGCCDWGNCRGGTDAESERRWHRWFHKGDISAPLTAGDPALTPRLCRAYAAARSARFEHGDRGR